MKKQSSGMGKPFKEHWEKPCSQLQGADLKYTPTEMGNPEELDKANRGLVSYLKSHKTKEY